MDHYILVGKKAVSVDFLEWAKWFECADRVVEKTDIGDSVVSTVFLGLDHRFNNSEGAPLIFETLVFGGEMDGETFRYSTWEEAETGHKLMCSIVSSKCRPGDEPENIHE